MIKLLCDVRSVTVMLLVISFCQPAGIQLLARPAVTSQSILEAPEFRPPEYPAYEVDLIFGMFNPNGEGSTEIYRSLHPTENFELLTSVPAHETTFLDQGLRSNTTYYYRLRAELDGEVSEFSNTLELTTGFRLYPPRIDAESISSTVIEVTLHDVSYNDVSYDIWRERGPDAALIGTIHAPDSGEVFTILDTALLPGTTYNYRVDVHAQGPGNVYYPGMVRTSATTFEQETLEAPALMFHEPPEYFTCGNEIGINFTNINAGSTTEIYRSRDSVSGFELIYSHEGSGSFVDTDLASTKMYYYKARAVQGDSYSAYSDLISKETGYAFFEPEFEVTVLPDKSVAVKIHDRSYLDYSYELYGWNAGDGIQTITTVFNLPDSGQTFTVIDTLVIPGETYTYHVNATLDCDGYPRVDEEFVSEPIQISDQPTVNGFTLVDPATDEDVAELYDSMEFNVHDRLNIRANTSGLTKSVAFYINGVRYWGENQEPYALFGDRFGDYNRGRFRPGEYILTAVPYGENLHQGTQGVSKTVFFRVIDDQGSTDATSFAEVNVFPNPIVESATIEIAGAPQSAVSLDIVDQFGNPVNHSDESIDHFGFFVKEWDARNLQSGTYYLTIKVENKTYTKRMLIK